jgi:hypothetical protein
VQLASRAELDLSKDAVLVLEYSVTQTELYPAAEPVQLTTTDVTLPATDVL